MVYMVYIKKDGEWVRWSDDVSFADAVREAEYLKKYEGLYAEVR